MMMTSKQGPIGIFDSGYGGLTVLKEITTLLPQYNYLYLGDNARSPYGTRSFSTIYQYTLQCVQWFFNQGCTLVILACNTASAKALRTIQQKYLPLLQDENKRVLGVIRPTSEIIGQYSKTNHVGILATSGTVQSNSYTIEIEKFFPQIKVYQQACPMWVPLIENNEHNSAGADYFIQKEIHNLLLQQPAIDTLLLACTHYPLLLQKIKNYVPATTTILTQGTIVAQSLQQYLAKHKAINNLCSKQGQVQFYTTDDVTDFNNHATVFFGKAVQANHIDL
jgi:glutamate racemase